MEDPSAAIGMGVAADEPRAALIGREVLASGGSAGDAAVAMAFALTATYPGRASLGGGGVCVVREPKTLKTEALDFLPRAPAAAIPPGAPPIAVPGLARGMFAVHARLGQLRWEEMVSPGERIARFGIDVSRAFARDLPGAAAMIERDANARAVFANDKGAPLATGERMRQLDLAGQLGRIRAEGAGALYSGQGAQGFVAGVRALGGVMSVEDLRDYRAIWEPTLKVKFGDHIAHFAPQAVGGLAAAELWAMLGASDKWDGTRADERAHLIAEATARAGVPVPVDAKGQIAQDWGDRALRGYDPARHIAASPAPGAASEDGESTGFIAMDRAGGAVACILTAGGLFGVHAIVPSTGIVAAQIPDPAALWSLAPMVVANDFTKDTILAAAAGGDASAPVALNEVLLPIRENKTKPADAVSAPRLTYNAAIDVTTVESTGDDIARSLTVRGHRVGRVPALARVNVMYCSGGTRREGQSCMIATDPRGIGLASGADR